MRCITCITILVFLAASQPLAAQTNQCGPRDMVLNMLAAQDQARRAIGLAGRVVMEVFAAPESAHWTITVTLADGRMCVLATGIAFEAVSELMPIQGTAL
ncbi:hypothetical protein [Roseinatronobacter sp.]|uniref:hypothetical protein n=1 Tax=Roseinatronobacter sp. TaxID=1945755 RepID=UPI0025F7CC89|nr:hypothetical protein [Rhodobaca sp.]